jgi:hypothetical protein
VGDEILIPRANYHFILPENAHCKYLNQRNVPTKIIFFEILHELSDASPD